MNIFKKPLSQAPKWLQNLIIRLHRYCFEFKYTSGAQLHIADAPSRAHLITETHPTKIMNVDALYFVPDKQVHEVEEESSKEATLQKLKQVITEGWPSQKQDIPSCIQPYYDLRDTLSVQNGVIVKGECILIPHTLQKSMLRKLHYAHLGLDSMLQWARNTVFWLNMTKNLRDTANNCEPCQALCPTNRKEPLLQHEMGENPWEKIGNRKQIILSNGTLFLKFHCS